MKESRTIKLLWLSWFAVTLWRAGKTTETPLDTSFSQEPSSKEAATTFCNAFRYLSTAQRHALMHATVQFLMLYNKGTVAAQVFRFSTILTQTVLF
jgi:hypothetical protein